MTLAALSQSLIRWLLVPAPAEAPDAQVSHSTALAQAFLEQAEHSLTRDGVAFEGANARRAHTLAALAALREAARHAMHARGGEGSAAIDEALTDAARSALTRGAAEDHARTDDGLDGDARAAKAAVTTLLRDPEERCRPSSQRLVTRVSRWSAVVVLGAAAVVAVRTASRELRPDLAPAARWSASSAQLPYQQQGRGFHPIEGAGNIFFQTAIEPEPWVEFDLGAARSLRMVLVQNRLDTQQDWAVPLVCELSTDHVRWKVIESQNEPFHFWRVTFPTTTARWVRLRVPRETSLHLGRVEIR